MGGQQLYTYIARANSYTNLATIAKTTHTLNKRAIITTTMGGDMARVTRAVVMGADMAIVGTLVAPNSRVSFSISFTWFGRHHSLDSLLTFFQATSS